MWHRIFASKISVDVLEVLYKEKNNLNYFNEFRATDLTKKINKRHIPTYQFNDLENAELISSRIDGKERFISLTEKGEKVWLLVKKLKDLLKKSE